MRPIPRRPAILLAASLLVACGQPATANAQSLVGTKSLPAASALSREKIQITLGRDAGPSQRIFYDLKPDNSWTVTALAADLRKRLGTRTVKLTSGQARSAREKLWRLRPAALGGFAERQVPTGCSLPPTGSAPDASVVFQGPGNSPGREKMGIFILPVASACNSPDAVAARTLIEQVMNDLPKLAP